MLFVTYCRSSIARAFLHQHGRRSTSVLLSIQPNGEGRKGKTGWNHNPPSESSSFWDSSSGDPAKEVPSDENKKQLRTGWLHNTESPSAAAAREPTNPTAAPAGGAARRRLEMAMKEQSRNHCLISPPTFHAAGSDGQIVVTEHTIRLPVDRNNDKSERVQVYFSIVEKVSKGDAEFWQSLMDLTPRKRAEQYVQWAAMKNADSMVLYLQGGPGFGAPTPVVGLGLSGSWAATALGDYKRVVLMDQRGTGRSSPITKQTLEMKFPELFLLDGSTEPVASLSEVKTDNEETRM